MDPGERVVDRFTIRALAGTGGMGEVYRAHDAHQDEDIALKVLRVEGLATERFVREAQVLSTLSHPHIVEYVAHGVTAEGRPYLAMEWLEGEDLASRLERGPISAKDAMQLGMRVASALSVAHDRGVVHRDLKPENIFLVGGDIAEPRILDFGIARVLEATHALTRTGVMIGTPGYTSPEQARGDADIGPSTDVFALGCVLFECVTGRRAFEGEHIVAILAKLLLAEPPRASAFRTDIPSEFDALLVRMMAKASEDRPRDAEEVKNELDAVRRETGATSDMPIATRSFMPHERRVVSVILAGTADLASAKTLASGESEERLKVIDDVARTRDVRVEALADGTHLLVLEGGGEAKDRVERAAIVALTVRAAAPSLPMSLATGWTRAGTGLPVGEVIDRAVRLLSVAAEQSDRTPIAVDAATATLLRVRFDVEERGDAHVLLGEADLAAPIKLGRAMPFVGRERFMARLVDLADECFSERLPRCVVVTGEPGIGKSRVRQEILRYFADLEEAPLVWFGRGDALRRGVPHHVLRQMLSRGLLGDGRRDNRETRDRAETGGAQDVARRSGAQDEDAAADRALLQGRLLGIISVERLHRVEPFLAELLDIAPDEDPDLAVARAHPGVLKARLNEAFSELAVALTAKRPVVLVIEDTHYGDISSYKTLEAAMRREEDFPLLVLGFSRPELREMLPLLQTDWDLTIMRLRGLRNAQAERLARRVLGDKADQESVARVVRLAQGNPLQLEELLRATLEGESEHLPESLATVMSSRLERLDPKLRAVIRAACIYGETFRVDGVLHLLGVAWDRASLDKALSQLDRAEIVRPVGERRQAKSEAYRFNQGLLRDAAYASLSAADRATGHGLAADLEAGRPAPEANVLAHHLISAGRHKDAGVVLLRAAEEAWATGDSRAVLAAVGRAREIGTAGPVWGRLCLFAARAQQGAEDVGATPRAASEALDTLEEGETDWWAALAERARWGTVQKAPEGVTDAARLAEAPDDVLCRPDVAIAFSATTYNLMNTGPASVAVSLANRMESAYRELDDAWARAALASVRARRAYGHGDFAKVIEQSELAYDAFTELGDRGKAAWQLVVIAYSETTIGRYGKALGLCARARREAEAVRDAFTVSQASLQLAHCSCRLGEVGPAIPLIKAALEESRATGDAFTLRIARSYLAFAFWRMGQHEEAMATARENLQHNRGDVEVASVFTGAILVAILVEIGRYGEAIEVATPLVAAARIDDSIGEDLLRLSLVRALDGAGQGEAAEQALAAARDRILAGAARISDEEMRRAYLEESEARAITLLEAKNRLGA